MAQNFALGNIVRVKSIDLTEGSFEDPNGFFLRSVAGATVVYIPLNNQDDEMITKTFPASEKFEDPEIIRTVVAAGSPLPNDLYVGYGV